MPRAISTAMLAALQSSSPKLCLLVSMAFKSETAYLWTGVSSITWNSQTWLGGGRVLSVSPIEEGSTVEARGIVIRISGIDVTLLSEVISDYQLGGAVTVYLGALDGSGALIASPVPAWTGRMDKPLIKVSGQTATIDINCETRLIDMNVAVDRRRTNDDQQQMVPNDLAMQFVDALQELTISFGTSTIATKNL